ncbi:ParB/RepB/Spo0J family partition protein [Saprospiraceae bacterium]|jgi:ParB family chromosome partitioning protein|nr:ParB/RepB/Spo0J family partition protein [Bacteroidota bacterium]MDB4727227.1 ParB/RepB/Spo0J family partition protein [Saprospiraceae bacterium]
MAKKVRRTANPRASKEELKGGLKALFRQIDNAPDDTASQTEVVKELANTVANIPLDQIEVNPHQPRSDFDEDALNDLADSIRIYGIIQPLTIRRMAPNQYQLISGERRMRASKIAGLTEVPAYIRLAKDDKELMAMAVVENVQREKLNPIEMAISLVRLKDEFELKDQDIASIIGKRRSTITNYRSVLKLPEPVQNSLREEEISMGHAKALVGVKDKDLIHHYHTVATEQHLSVRALEDLIKRDKVKAENKKAPKPTSKLPDEYDRVQSNLQERFGIKRVQLKLKDDGKGQIVIPFNSVEDLNRILDVIEE